LILYETLEEKNEHRPWAMMDDAKEDLELTWNWVKGHSTNVMNQRVDKIAVAESTKQQNKKTRD
jgi:ribonuclease HI